MRALGTPAPTSNTRWLSYGCEIPSLVGMVLNISELENRPCPFCMVALIFSRPCQVQFLIAACIVHTLGAVARSVPCHRQTRNRWVCGLDSSLGFLNPISTLHIPLTLNPKLDSTLYQRQEEETKWREIKGKRWWRFCLDCHRQNWGDVLGMCFANVPQRIFYMWRTKLCLARSLAHSSKDGRVNNRHWFKVIRFRVFL